MKTGIITQENSKDPHIDRLMAVVFFTSVGRGGNLTRLNPVDR